MVDSAINERHEKKAVVLLSGGMDSAVVLAMAKAQGYACYALTVDYHQRNRCELDSAKKVAAAMGVAAHRVVTLDMHQWGGSALTEPDRVVPKTPSTDIPATYVPARNAIFLSLALSWAEALGACDLFFGANQVDSPNYPDCSPDFLAAFAQAANQGCKPLPGGAQYRVHAPVVDMNKVEIIQTGRSLNVPFALTFSCYDPTDEHVACGVCDACRLRISAFSEVHNGE